MNTQHFVLKQTRPAGWLILFFGLVFSLSFMLNTEGWGWKRVTQANLDDALNFLNGSGAYTGKIKNPRITPAVDADNDFIVYYQNGDGGNWGWKRVTNKDLDDLTNFMNGKGAYTHKIANVEIVPLKNDFIAFYQTGGTEGWGWKRVTSLNMNDAIRFLNGTGVYKDKLKAVEIFALQDGARTDLIVYYQKGQPQISGTWKYKYFTSNDKVKDFLGTVRESEVVTTGNRYLVFYK